MHYRLEKLFFFIFVVGFFLIISSCGSKTELPVSLYYEYDQKLPLDDSVKLVSDSLGYNLYAINYRSVHDKTVTGLLTIPEGGTESFPVIILMHGKGDRKTVDYIEAGHEFFRKSGYAVLRLDIDDHGDRLKDDYDFSLVGDFRYWTRDLVSQTVFDLRRAIDFIETREDVDSQRVGYYGISLGGIIGTLFCAVDDRVKVPVIVLAGGSLNLMFGMDALSADTKNFLSIIDPINFVKLISPRPLLMINAENDDIVPPITSKLLFNKADKPKEIIWYPSKHHTLPIDKAYPDGIKWFDKYL